jgi:diaminopimelate epimerase
MRIPFLKAHGAANDFLLTWASDAPSENLPAIARRICTRHTGVGADGWLIVSPSPQGAAHNGTIRLINSDGSEAELSGNGTRCAAALLLGSGNSGPDVRIMTGAGIKHLRLIESADRRYQFEMNMGNPRHAGDGDLRFPLKLRSSVEEVTILDVGNPQCAVIVSRLPEDWLEKAREIEGHPHFPKRTNVSFVRVVDEHTIDVRFYERGAGETQSSGTGSTGAMAAAVLLGLAKSPVRVLTPAGPLDLRWDGDIFLTGPAEIVAEGVFFCD